MPWGGWGLDEPVDLTDGQCGTGARGQYAVIPEATAKKDTEEHAHGVEKVKEVEELPEVEIGDVWEEMEPQHELRPQCGGNSVGLSDQPDSSERQRT